MPPRLKKTRQCHPGPRVSRSTREVKTVAVNLRLSRVHARHTDGRTRHQFQAPTVRALISELEAAYPALAGRFSDGSGGLRAGLSLFVNDRYITSLSEADIELNDGDEVSIIPYIAGG